MLPLNDPRWAKYRGGYNRSDTVDVIPFLRKLQLGELAESDWDLLWDDLHHQGNVGEASYAVVPYLAKYAAQADKISWHAFGFPAVVELERHQPDNPDIPHELEESYNAALIALPRIALSRGEAVWGDDCFEPVMACLALSLGRREHAKAYLDLTRSEISAFYEYYYGDRK